MLDHYLLVQCWRPFFNSKENQVRKIAAWVHIPDLPVELFNNKFLWKVGSHMGTMQMT